MSEDPDDDLTFDNEDETDEHQAGEFICPECEGREAGQRWMVSADPVKRDPWSEILEILKCDSCGSRIPAHLGERWDGISVEQARAEWRSVYRQQQPRI